MTTKKKSKNKKANGGSTRPAPMVPKAGLKKGRYGCGGKLKK